MLEGIASQDGRKGKVSTSYHWSGATRSGAYLWDHEPVKSWKVEAKEVALGVDIIWVASARCHPY